MPGVARFLIITSCLLTAFSSGCAKDDTATWADLDDTEDFVGPNSTAEIRAQNHAIVASCLRKIPNHSSSSLRSGRKYLLMSENDELRIRLKIHFAAVGMSPERAEELLGKANDCLSVMKSVWQRYGINWDLSFDSSPVERPRGPEVNVQLFDEVGRSSAYAYYYRGALSDKGRQLASDKWQYYFCTTMLHETGHLLGLDDEYSDPEVPDRKYVSSEKRPWSIMNDHWHHLEVLDFYPRHISTVLAPLCD